MKIRFCIRGGSVKSKTDGDYHDISSAQLITLYGVGTGYYEGNLIGIRRKGYKKDNEYILGPRYDGNYTVNPEEVGFTMGRRSIERHMDFENPYRDLVQAALFAVGYEKGRNEEQILGHGDRAERDKQDR